tara:strand:- start:67 stop:756 length:690 start_codon:yes stop_codon:yes gene_type:complete
MSSYAQLVVLQARGGGFKVGQSISPEKTIVLKEGERVTLIGGDGKSTTLRGPYNAPPLKQGSSSKADPSKALSLLIASRDARTSSIGVIRAGTDAVQTPDPIAIDVSRGGPRCLFQGNKPEFWRPNSSTAENFVMFPVDRSWRADLVWKVGQDRLIMPDLSKFEGVTTVLINFDQQEHAISFNVIPKNIKDEVVLTAWMLEKGCIQQANALLTELSKKIRSDPNVISIE